MPNECNLKFDDDYCTPLNITDAVVRKCCGDKEVLEDVVYYLSVYIEREFGRRATDGDSD